LPGQSFAYGSEHPDEIAIVRRTTEPGLSPPIDLFRPELVSSEAEREGLTECVQATEPVPEVLRARGISRLVLSLLPFTVAAVAFFVFLNAALKRHRLGLAVSPRVAIGSAVVADVAGLIALANLHGLFNQMPWLPDDPFLAMLAVVHVATLYFAVGLTVSAARHYRSAVYGEKPPRVREVSAEEKARLDPITNTSFTLVFFLLVSFFGVAHLDGLKRLSLFGVFGELVFSAFVAFVFTLVLGMPVLLWIRYARRSTSTSPVAGDAERRFRLTRLAIWIASLSVAVSFAAEEFAYRGHVGHWPRLYVSEAAWDQAIRRPPGNYQDAPRLTLQVPLAMTGSVAPNMADVVHTWVLSIVLVWLLISARRLWQTLNLRRVPPAATHVP
jgi:hypothetical protein